MPARLETMSQQLHKRKEELRLRQLLAIEPLPGARLRLDGKVLTNFASNDYLGLSTHPELKRRAIACVERYGVGNPSSRLISGNLHLYEQLEQKLAKLKQTESALIFPSGYQANLTVLSALADAQTLLALDRLSHNSLLSGAQTSKARWTRYLHNDMADLEKELAAARAGITSRWIVSESVFSMDGDLANLESLQKLAGKHDAALFIDEAHAMGVFGDDGMGLTPGKKVDLAMGTFGKGCGSSGAYVAGSKTICDYLVNFCSGIIYSTALPPATLGAIDAALDVIPDMEIDRQQLLNAAEHLRRSVKALGLDVGASASQIIPIIVGKDADALSLAEHLIAGGFYAPAIRPPTVPDGQARVRISLSAAHTDEDVQSLIRRLSSWHAR